MNQPTTLYDTSAALALSEPWLHAYLPRLDEPVIHRRDKQQRLLAYYSGTCVSCACGNHYDAEVRPLTIDGVADERAAYE